MISILSTEIHGDLFTMLTTISSPELSEDEERDFENISVQVKQRDRLCRC